MGGTTSSSFSIEGMGEGWERGALISLHCRRAAVADLTDSELAASIKSKAAGSADEDDPRATIKGLLGSTYTTTDLALVCGGMEVAVPAVGPD